MDLHRKASFGLKPFLALILLLSAAVWGLLNIEKNTSPFFVDKEHPVRAGHIAHQDLFTRAAYSTFVLLRVKPDADIYHNSLVQALESVHESVGNISLIDLVDHHALERRFGIHLNAYGRAFSSHNEAVELLNTLSKIHDPLAVHELLGQYVFPVRSVKSLINSDNIYEQGDDLIIESNFVWQRIWEPETKAFIATNDLLRGGLFSNDEKGLLVQIEYAIDEENTQLNTQLLAAIQNAVTASVESNSLVDSVHYAGGPVLNNAISEVMERDNARYFPLVIAFVLLTLTLFYRSLRCALFGLSIAVMSIICTLALMPIFGITLNIVTTILPVFIITIAVTDSIHVMSSVRSSKERSNSRAVQLEIKKLLRPMFLTSLTTGVGFLSLSFTEISNIFGFGVMVAVSVVIAFLLSVTLLPHMLKTWPIQRNADASKEGRSEKIQSAFIGMVMHHRWPALLCALATLCIAILGLPQLKVDQASIEAFDEASVMRSDNQIFMNNGSGSVILSLWFRGDQEAAMLDPEMLSLMRSIQEQVSEHDFFVDSISLADYLDHLHKVLEGSDAPALNFNDTGRVRQYLFLLEGGAERDLDSVVTVGDYRQARLAISLEKDNSAAIKEIVDELNATLLKDLPEGVEMSYTGYGALVNVAASEVYVSQLNSLITSVALIYLIFLAVFRSVSTALVGMLPLLATLTTMFGLMGMFGYPLDIGSSLVAGIAFGIGIDYSIHFIEALRRQALRGEGSDRLSRNEARKESITLALSQVTLPIGISAVVLSSGFSLLMLSGFKSLASLGLLVMVSMLVSALFTLVILPLILQILPEPVYRSIAKRRSRSTAMSIISELDDEMIVLESANDQGVAAHPDKSVSNSIK